MRERAGTNKEFPLCSFSQIPRTETVFHEFKLWLPEIITPLCLELFLFPSRLQSKRVSGSGKESAEVRG